MHLVTASKECIEQSCLLYISSFIDCDMYMRYADGGVGHFTTKVQDPALLSAEQEPDLLDKPLSEMEGDMLVDEDSDLNTEAEVAPAGDEMDGSNYGSGEDTETEVRDVDAGDGKMNGDEDEDKDEDEEDEDEDEDEENEEDDEDREDKKKDKDQGNGGDSDSSDEELEAMNAKEAAGFAPL